MELQATNMVATTGAAMPFYPRCRSPPASSSSRIEHDSLIFELHRGIPKGAHRCRPSASMLGPLVAGPDNVQHAYGGIVGNKHSLFSTKVVSCIFAIPMRHFLSWISPVSAESLTRPY